MLKLSVFGAKNFILYLFHLYNSHISTVEIYLRNKNKSYGMGRLIPHFEKTYFSKLFLKRPREYLAKI